jgi:hypothetical protein
MRRSGTGSDSRLQSSWTRRMHDSHRIDPPVCRISYWQGYVTGRYYAHTGDRSGALLCSASFRTWRWRHGNVSPHGGEAASAALEELVRELQALGWRLAGDTKAISRETVLSALSRISGDDGATAAEVGREVLGNEAPRVEHLPMRIGAELRRLQLQGKVERRQDGGTPRWFLTA